MKTLRAKFIFWISSLFILMAVLIFFPLSMVLPKKISAQVLKRDIKIAQYLSREIQRPLLVNNKLALRLLLEERLENLEDVMYIFIRGQDRQIIASTFKKGFPRGLLEINAPGKRQYSVVEFIADGKRVYDIAVPLLMGELGSLHLGVSLESSKPEIAEFTRINYYLGGVILFGLGMGIIVFALLGITLSNRIIRLKNFASRIGSGDLTGRIEINTNDEIEALASALNEMAVRLRKNIEEIKRLDIAEERNRIALDLHDGCAQELATIIKNIELCERLSGTDPARALGELRALREGVKEVLNKTRQTIYDLKLPEGADFNLAQALKNYIQAYKAQNAVNVELSVGDIGAISPEAAKQIFYIIGEALVNIKKHSRARNVELRLGQNDNNELSIDIKDDGRGFDTSALSPPVFSHSGLGLTGMRQRAASLGGELSIKSIPGGEGTAIHVDIPLIKRGCDSRCRIL